MSAFFERLRASARERASLLCVGLDPEPDRIPGGVDGALRHCLAVVEATRAVAAAYKPNSAFWEQYGPPGMAALAELRREIGNATPVILDAKRSDIGSTSAAYARAAFDVLGFDALTVHAYHGLDSLREFTRRPDRGVYVVCRTSNPGAADLQLLAVDGIPLYQHVARLAERAAGPGNVGLVAGATAAADVAALRAVSGLPFLLPGIGAQGGDLAASLQAAWTGDPAGCLVSSSRSVMYASDPGAAAAELVDQMRRLVPVEA